MPHAGEAMPAEAPFLFSIAALSVSLAGLAGLVAALRRTDGLRPIDLFRLQEIVEFAFANALIALGVVALSSAFGGATAASLAGIGILAYLVGNGVGLVLRLRRMEIWERSRWMLVTAALNVVGISVALATA